VTDLDRTDNCPKGHRCESCGTEHAELTVRTARTPLGVMCLTLCPRCARSDCVPPVSVGTAARLVGQHYGHLGITDDDAEAILRGER
jgi:hypothetical protein